MLAAMWKYFNSTNDAQLSLDTHISCGRTIKQDVIQQSARISQQIMSLLFNSDTMPIILQIAYLLVGIILVI